MSLRKSLTRRDFARTVLVASAGIGGASYWEAGRPRVLVSSTGTSTWKQ